MKLIITIDAEEDNWGRYSATDNPVENIRQIVPLQKIFDEFGVKPTYLVNYPVATSPSSVAILNKFLAEGNCEIGMHCHSWNTPPFDGEVSPCEEETMLCNLSKSMVQDKLWTLYQVIEKNFGKKPVSFRAGRWGFSRDVAMVLIELGCRVDSSVTPYVDWGCCPESNFSNFSPDPFWFNAEDNFRGKKESSILEVPATISYLQRNTRLCQQVMKACEKPFVRRLRLKGVLDRMGLVNKVWLSPEMADVKAMIRLASIMEKRKRPCINFFFHSNTLLPGLGPYTKSSKDVEDFIQKIKDFLAFAKRSGWQSTTLGQFADEYASVDENSN